jgi:hypothetical protein
VSVTRKPQKWVIVVATLVWLFFACVVGALQFLALSPLERLPLGLVTIFLLWLALVAPAKTRCYAILVLVRARRGIGA